MEQLNGKVFRIGSVDYKVEMISRLSERHGLWGQVTYKDTTVQLEDTMSELRTNEILMHELTHALFFEAGYSEHEEEMVNRIAKVLHGFLRDNDVSFLRENDEVCPRCGFEFGGECAE